MAISDFSNQTCLCVSALFITHCAYLYHSNTFPFANKVFYPGMLAFGIMETKATSFAEKKYRVMGDQEERMGMSKETLLRITTIFNNVL